VFKQIRIECIAETDTGAELRFRSIVVDVPRDEGFGEKIAKGINDAMLGVLTNEAQIGELKNASALIDASRKEIDDLREKLARAEDTIARAGRSAPTPRAPADPPAAAEPPAKAKRAKAKKTAEP